MKGITVKLPDTTLRRLGQEARAIGRSVAALIRERLEAALRRGSRSVYEITSDLAGSVEGDRKAATNDRRRFAVVITICDTGPLVAYLNRNDPYHSWAVGLMKQIRPPMRTCEAVLTEVAYFLREDGLDADPLFQLLERDAVRVHFDLSTHWPRVRTLMGRYERMDLADASIVVMTELHKRCQVLTLDRKDFSIYRRNDRQTIDFIAPRKP